MNIFDINNPNFYIIIVLALVNTIFMCFVARKFLQILQIGSYSVKNYFEWIKDTKAKWISRIVFLSLLCFIAMFVCNVLFRNYGHYKLITYLGLIFYFWFMLVFIINLKNTPEKKKLVLTRRMFRIIMLLAIIMAGITFVLLFLSLKFNNVFRFSLIAITPALLPLIVPLIVWILYPLEKLINIVYVKKAKKKLEKAEPIIKIGITGSYGKTTTKIFLTKLLEKKYEVVSTPESFNTPLGITKTINQLVKKNTQVFVCEMGADKVGDIKEICNIVSPQIGVLTAVGSQHLKSFGSLENIAKTKYELIESLPSNGLAFFNTSGEEVKKLFDKCELRNKVDCNVNGNISIKNVHINRAGLKFDLVIDNETYPCKTKILGEHNLQNILTAVNVAYYMEVDVKDIVDTIANLEPVYHRLELKESENGVVIIDDSFNSNEEGSLCALKVLSLFKKNRKIVVTPGLVELGEREEQANILFGENIADYCDICIIVNKYNKDAIKKGLENKNFNKENIYEVESLYLATELFRKILCKGDVVLLENDLPDNYI